MIYPYPNVLSSLECDKIIQYATPLLKDLTVLNPKGEVVSKSRTGKGAFISDPNNEVFSKVKNLASRFTNLPVENQEPLQVLRYQEGEKYNIHHDFYDPNDKSHQVYLKNGGNRRFSCLFYLNDDFEEGGTFFPHTNILVIPKKGNLVIWNNTNSKGIPNIISSHTAMPVKRGIKWALIIWVRQYKIK